MTGCFLCDPDRDLVFFESPNFFAMVGWGPITMGYSLFATKPHVRSMFDVEPGLLDERRRALHAVRRILSEAFGTPIVAEHGRVGLCVDPSTAPTREHDPHCLHAHNLLFPQGEPFGHALSAEDFRPLKFDSFESARVGAGHLTEYLYYEDEQGVMVGHANLSTLPRQFFRTAAATAVGQPERSDWRSNPNLDDVNRARRLLGDLYVLHA